MGTAGRAEIVIAEQPTKRRFRSKEERRRIVEETLQPGASVAVIARRHNVNANQVFHWRKLYREGRLDRAQTPAALLPVCVTEVVSRQPPAAQLYSGVIVVEVGRTRIRIEGTVDSDNLRLVLERVSR